VGQPVALAADQRDGGVQQRAHGLAATGDAGDEAPFGVAHDVPHFAEDEFRGRLVLHRGADVLEQTRAPGAVVGQLDDAGRLGDQLVVAGSDGLAQGLPNGAATPFRQGGVQAPIQGLRPRGGGDESDPSGQHAGLFASERPDCLGNDGGRQSGDGEEVGVHRATGQ